MVLESQSIFDLWLDALNILETFLTMPSRILQMSPNLDVGAILKEQF